MKRSYIAYPELSVEQRIDLFSAIRGTNESHQFSHAMRDGGTKPAIPKRIFVFTDDSKPTTILEFREHETRVYLSTEQGRDLVSVVDNYNPPVSSSK